ncbi:sensor histidine kinase [Micromonospora inyonensis]|uniref:histidine kinase n=1 Tax=Micromonospora inyonensis TaxID=47866 RepID=A0A1C6SPD2_9ACTN|nr:HAMP domain-containing sensor histidine kinase [Micromonospora inyonensis]SCL31149.1 Signal transduction histidine kinase [Micromonospora inyonensis]
MTRPSERDQDSGPVRVARVGSRRPPTIGLRGRLTLVSVLGLAVGLAVGGLALLGALGHVLQRSVDDEAFRTADAVALLAAENALPDPLPVVAGQVRVQVVDRQGRVRAASIDADRLVPMLPVDRIDHSARDRTFVRGERLGLPGRVRVVSVPAGTPSEPLTVLVGKSMADVTQSAEVVRFVLLVSFPLLVAILGGVAWRVVGATLRPVEALRSGAEEITGRAGGGRLPVPASRDEIHRLAITLNDMLARLEAARARQRAFLADAAHELRSPLTNMRTELEVAGRLGERTDWPAVSRDLLADTERLSRLVDDLLLLARLDEAGNTAAGTVGAGTAAGTGAPGRGAVGGRRATGPVELVELVRAVADRFPSPPVRVLPASGPRWTVGDADELHRVLTNLIDNAVRHCRSAVVIEVTGDPGAGTHLVTVTDDGPGIPAADRERVFDRFTRLDDARARDAGGAGLGLAIVRELVRLHGGTVRLSDAGPGLRVSLHLPALPDAET